MYTVKYFMWGFQCHFEMSARQLIRDLCELIGCDLKPSLFLVGFLEGKHKGFLPICVEPEDCAYQPDVFKNVVAKAQEAAETPRDTITISPSEWHAQDHERRYRLGCLAQAVLDTVEAKSDPNQILTYCTRMVRVENYQVALFLQIDRAARDAWPHLHKRAYQGAGVPVSLIDCLIDEFLNICADDLSKPEPGRWIGERKDLNSIVRAAGRSLMYKASAAGDEMHGLHGLFETCNTIASLKYEGNDGAGTIVIARKDHPAIDRSVTFADPVELANYRSSRKLLELCHGPLALICNSFVIYGLGTVSDRYDPTLEDVYEIRFLQQHTWELMHASQVLMRTVHGTPVLPHERFNVQRFEAILTRVIPNVPAADANRLVALARKASEARNGTMLVISPKARAEADRLHRQGTRVEPIALTPELLELVTPIDGAVLMTPDATCHGIGVILDGRATPKGTPARGSRYNSAVRYVEQEKDCIAVVVSEDGMIDVLPELKARIRRSDMENIMGRLRALSTIEAPDDSEYRTVMNWLDKHRFYLSEAVCDEVNRLWKPIDQKLSHEGFRTVFDEFAPNPEMDDSHFIDG